MAITADIDETDRAGIALCAFQVTRKLGLVFREQGTSDFGVDAQAEMKRDGRPTGRLVGLQIKAGPSYFGEPYDLRSAGSDWFRDTVGAEPAGQGSGGW